MNFVQTLYFNEAINPLKYAFGWAAPEYHLMGWALSCLQLQQLYTKVDLYCNSKAASLLKDQLGLPYTNIYKTHDNLKIADQNLWALHKIFTYSLQNEPFLHLDGDVFLFKDLPSYLLNSELIAQNMEEATFESYSNTQKALMRHFTYFPDCVKNEFDNTTPIKAVNAGILGGRDTVFIKEYAEIAFKYVNRNVQHLSSVSAYGFNVFFEQHLFYSLAKEKGLPINFLFKETIKDNKYKHLGDFHNVSCKNNYLHLIGQYKRDEYTCRQMAAKLRQLYPEYYYRIISLCKKEFAPLTVSFYTNGRFTTVSDYIEFNKKSKEIYSHSSSNGIPNITSNIINSAIQSSEITIVALLEKQVNEMTRLNSIARSEAERDLKTFSKNIRKVLMTNKGIPVEYIYGRDLESVNWFCELFGYDSYVQSKMIIKCNEIAIIKSAFDWGGLLNKIKRIGVEYYEVLQLERGEFYNLITPEISADGFTIQDLDEMEKIILEHLSKPLSIKELLTKMHIYAEEDIIMNHLEEYENLVIVMLKQLVLKKAIKPVF